MNPEYLVDEVERDGIPFKLKKSDFLHLFLTPILVGGDGDRFHGYLLYHRARLSCCCAALAHIMGRELCDWKFSRAAAENRGAPWRNQKRENLMNLALDAA